MKKMIKNTLVLSILIFSSIGHAVDLTDDMVFAAIKAAQAKQVALNKIYDEVLTMITEDFDINIYDAIREVEPAAVTRLQELEKLQADQRRADAVRAAMYE